ncbi:MAG: Ca-activated chloride channel family protein, partial [Dinoroseobacter sp.]
MTLRFVAFCLSLSLAALPARACTTALLLAIDVSQSIDSGEYRIQTDGMADALLDPEVAYALINGQVALMVVQWSGRDDQIVSIPWTQIRTDTDLERFAHASRTMRRAFVMSSTGVGALVRFAHTQFRNAPACTRQVIDI